MNDGSPTDRDAKLAAIRSVMVRVFGVSGQAIDETTQRGHIERWDSLNMVSVAIGLERRLGRPVEIDACVNAGSVKELLDILCR